MPPDTLRTLAGDCRIEVTDNAESVHRGRVLVVLKPDGTVLVHDVTGYQPIAWLTRADDVGVQYDVPLGAVAADPAAEPPTPPQTAAHPGFDAVGSGGGDPAPFVVTAATDDRQLRIVAERDFGTARYPASPAGPPAGRCPDCGDPFVATTGAIRCTGCGREHGLPTDAEVVDRRCECGCPQVRVDRGATFTLCADRSCDPLDAAVRDRFEGDWDCPVCGAPLRVLRRGGLIAGCDRYPACETGFAIPAGVVDGECDCGLPVFDTGAGRRCLDGTCSRSTDVA